MKRQGAWLDRAGPLLAWCVGLLTVSAGIAAAVLAVADTAPMPWKSIIIAVVWAIPGTLIGAGRPRILVGWLVLGAALVFATAGLASQLAVVASERGDRLGTAWALWFADRFSACLVVFTLLALLLLPDGRLPSRRWRVVVAVVVSMQSAAVVAWVLTAGPAAGPEYELAGALEYANPLGLVPAEVGAFVGSLEGLLLQAPFLLCPVVFGARIIRAKGAERARVGMILLAATVFVLLVLVGHAWWPAVADVLDIVGGIVLAVAVTAAVLKRHLTGIDVVVHHAVVFSTLTVVIACGYAAAVWTAAALSQVRPPVASRPR